MRRLPTGIDVLDRTLSGGIPVGSVVVLSAAPASQSELLLSELTAPRETLYLTTERSAAAVREAFERTTAPTGAPEVAPVPAEAPLDGADRLIEGLSWESTLIVDPTDPLERCERARYRRFMNDLRAAMVDAESVAVLHCLLGANPPVGRDVTEYMADVVFSLETRIIGDSIENRLAVPKFRGGCALSETIKLELGDRVRVDTSRDIA
ncbi:RAD55 family ATPase [Halalkalicoccus subterraneus]|uniref:RAD55 family ATPase n=1 Tax=Halalkalicoccus subterraneus TaxID=2675002 RepID=UPI0034A4DE2D